jgi:toxin FitB
MTYLLDTCVISELVAKRPDPRVTRWIDSVDPESVYLSVVTIAEIRKGIEKIRESARKEALERWLHEDLLIRFRDHLSVLDTKVLLEWGTLTGRMEIQGTPMPAMDSLIAATALSHDLVLATRNERDFLNAGIKLFNPWTG